MKDRLLTIAFTTITLLCLGMATNTVSLFKPFTPGWLHTSREVGNDEVPMVLNMGQIVWIEPFGKKDKQTKIFFSNPFTPFIIVDTEYDEVITEIRKSAPSVNGNDPRDRGGHGGHGGGNNGHR